MAGNTSTYRFYEKDNSLIFSKKFDNKKILRTVDFQCVLQDELISDCIKINRPFDIIENTADGTLEVEYEYIDQKPWEINAETISKLGTGMAHIHNFCAHNKDRMELLELYTKSQPVDLKDWDLVKDSAEKSYAFKLRSDIIQKVNNSEHKFLIPLHRDFKLHNILFDGNDFHLIDFDFAAIDNINIEIASFIMDVIFNNPDDIVYIKDFIKAYKEASYLVDDIKWNEVMDDYIFYMCCNTFPFYMREKIGEDNFKSLLTERNYKLNAAYIHKDLINENLSR